MHSATWSGLVKDYRRDLEKYGIAGDSHPVIWLFNDGAQYAAQAQNVGPTLGHWEGFNANTKKGPNVDMHQEQIRDWALNNEAAQLVEDGVWLITTAFEGDGKDLLTVFKGHFLRPTDPVHDVETPEDEAASRCMKTTNNNNRGWVPEKNKADY